MNQALQRVLPPLGILLAFAVAAELALRAVHFEYPRADERVVIWNRDQDRAMREGIGLHELDRYEIWKPRAGASIPWNASETINADGLRGPVIAREKTKGTLRIATLGSDSTFGTGVAWHETWSAQLALALEKRGVHAEVLCGGVMHSTLRQGLERYRHLLREWHPNVVVCAYSGDCEYLPAPQCTTDAQEIELGRGAPLTLALASPAPGARERLLDVRDSLRSVHAAAWLFDLTRGSYWHEHDKVLQEKRLLMGIHGFDVPGVRRVSLPEFQTAIQTLAREVQADGAHLMLMPIPPKTRFGKSSPVLDMYNRLVADNATKLGLPLVFPRDAFIKSMKEGAVLEDLYIPGSPLAPGTQVSPRAHALLAETVCDQIVAHLDEYPR